MKAGHVFSVTLIPEKLWIAAQRLCNVVDRRHRLGGFLLSKLFAPPSPACFRFRKRERTPPGR
jgi:hypothetical protein